jgi:mono/diheme cytochrome c family protein
MAPRTGFVQCSRKAFEIIVLMAGAVVMAAAALDAAHGAEKAATQASERELIPGAERMTAAERDAYRKRMESATTPEEKARIRAEFAKAAEKQAAPIQLTGDPKRGAKLHGACFGCHGIERYTAPVTHATATFFDSVLRASGLSDLPPSEPASFKGRIRSVDALRAAVNRRNEYFSPKMTPQEIEDVVAYLNETYYKFPLQAARAPEKQ